MLRGIFLALLTLALAAAAVVAAEASAVPHSMPVMSACERGDGEAQPAPGSGCGMDHEDRGTSCATACALSSVAIAPHVLMAQARSPRAAYGVKPAF
ncbi:MAG: hypothetical protein D6782_11695, partial [Alphaproteobacteria bacterium]